MIKSGITDADTISEYQDRFDRIPNLQLIHGQPNQEKSNKLFREWVEKQYPLEDERRTYMQQQYIPDVDLDLSNFIDFYDKRRELMRMKLQEITRSEGR